MSRTRVEDPCEQLLTSIKTFLRRRYGEEASITVESWCHEGNWCGAEATVHIDGRRRLWHIEPKPSLRTDTVRELAVVVGMSITDNGVVNLNVGSPNTSCTQVSTENLQPGSVVSGLSRNGNRYGVESVTQAKFSQYGTPSKDAFVVTLGLPGTEGGVFAMRCYRGDTWYVWGDAP